MKKSTTFVLILLIIVLSPAFCANKYYETGDQVFSFRAGVDFPAFVAFVNDSSRNQAFGDIHMQKVGGIASISYQGFLTEHLALGGELGYQFINSLTPELFTSVPITAKLTYVPVQTGLFDLALSANLGMAFIKYDESKYLAPYASITIQPSFYITDSWGIGIEAGITTIAELYTKNSGKSDSSAFFGAIPLALVVSYRH